MDGSGPGASCAKNELGMTRKTMRREKKTGALGRDDLSGEMRMLRKPLANFKLMNPSDVAALLHRWFRILHKGLLQCALDEH